MSREGSREATDLHSPLVRGIEHQRLTLTPHQVFERVTETEVMVARVLSRDTLVKQWSNSGQNTSSPPDRV